ncbi:uncharacterized protein [Amphiura filiformis]|uniref:uncharacterized protein isoform X2 n=1 Tax=Amphiura filiformis TaxID=82378 RepID=UPI003B20ECDF
MMNRNRRHNSSSIPSLLDMPSQSSSSNTGSTGLGASSYGSYGGQNIGAGLGLTGAGMSVADLYSTPVGYGNYSQLSSDTSLQGSINDGLLGNGLGGYGSSSMSSGLMGLGGMSSDDSFAAKVRLQQAMLAEEKQKSIQQQIQEQLEKQNKKRLEYNRMKRDRDNNRRRDDKRNDNRRHDDRRGDRGNSREGQKSEGLDDVHVTIKPRSEGRAVSDNTGGRKRNFSDKSRNQQRTEDTKGGSGDSTQQGPWKCHVCVITCDHLKGYELHMKGRKHAEAMEKMRVVTEFQAQQAVKRYQAENRLKNEQGRSRDDGYCRDCLTNYTGDLLAHRRTKEHKEARRTQRPHCRVCNVTFKTPKKYVAHCNTPGHKKVYEAAKKKGQKDIDDEDFVTVDSVGVFDDDDNDVLLAANVGDDNVQTNLGKGFDTAVTVTRGDSEDEVIDIDFDPESSDLYKSQEYVSDALASSVKTRMKSLMI